MLDIQEQLVLSVRQPWAWLIIRPDLTNPVERAAAYAVGEIKDIENRDWRIPSTMTLPQRVLVHASKGVTKDEWRDAWDWVRHVCPAAWEAGKRNILLGTIPRGGIVGSVEIVDCVARSDSRWFCGEYGFVLRDAQPLPFYPCKGQLKFFKI